MKRLQNPRSRVENQVSSGLRCDCQSAKTREALAEWALFLLGLALLLLGLLGQGSSLALLILRGRQEAGVRQGAHRAVAPWARAGVRRRGSDSAGWGGLGVAPPPFGVASG